MLFPGCQIFEFDAILFYYTLPSVFATLQNPWESANPLKSLRFWGWRLATRTFSSLLRFSMGLRSGDWLDHSRTLMWFFLSHSFVALAVCFGSLSCWNTHPRPIFNALAGFNALVLMVHGPVHRPFDAVQLSCPLSRKTPPKHNVSTSMFDGGDGVLGVIGSIPPPPNTASWVDAKELDFGLIWPQHFHPVLLWIIGFWTRLSHRLTK